jgi:adenine C2-methylase RlmN of 23S rRNA A2503 and tRNA A37
MATASFIPHQVDGLQTGALYISTASRRVISIPSQLGCRVGCTFCVSSETPLARNLRATEMVSMVRAALSAKPPDGRPLELSFTGEGESLHNLRSARAAALEVDQDLARLAGVRYSFSGLGASQLLREVPTDDFPTRLQFSLHAARQSLRDRLVPRSAPLSDILSAMRSVAVRFASVELNVVLQDGVNDSDDDLLALIHWGSPEWPVILNPMLTNGKEVIASRTNEFERALRAARRTVKRYFAVAASISRQGIYPSLSARAPKMASVALPLARKLRIERVTTSERPQVD